MHAHAQSILFLHIDPPFLKFIFPILSFLDVNVKFFLYSCPNFFYLLEAIEASMDKTTAIARILSSSFSMLIS